MANIFINYRRTDASGYAGRLYDRLASHFGAKHVFMDVDAIEPGDDFARVIGKRIAGADTVLVLIGPGWLGAADPEGRRRLDSPEDYVRVEVAAALDQGKTVIPVLVSGATMPAESELPPGVEPLARRHAFVLNDARFHADVDALIGKLDRKSGKDDRSALGGGAVLASRPKRKFKRWLVGSAVVATLLLGAQALIQELENAFDPVSYTASPSRYTVSPSPPSVRTVQPYAVSPRVSRDTAAEVEALRLKRQIDYQRQREIIDRYNRTAKSIIDSMGR